MERALSSRIACAVVPDFPLAALLRAEPELAGAAVAVIDGEGPRAQVLACTPEAARLGVGRGVTATQARAIAPTLIARSYSGELVQSAQAALLDAAAAFAARIEDAEPGMIYCDVSDLGRLFEREEQIASAFFATVGKMGLSGLVGIAGTKSAALIAARAGGGACVVPASQERIFLAPLPVSALGPSAELALTLERWGIHLVGDLAALPADGVASRLGAEGVRLHRLARGIDDAPLLPRPRAEPLVESIELEYEIEALEPLSFLLKGLLDRICERLDARGLSCRELALSLILAPRGRAERTVTIAAPTRDAKTLLSLCRTVLEAHPPEQAARGMVVTVLPTAPRPAQLGLLGPSGPAPEKLATALARLQALVGPDRVGSPALADTHRPDAVRMSPFAPPPPPLLPETAPPGCTRLALRAFRPPRLAEVHLGSLGLTRLSAGGLSGQVLELSGPWRLEGEWWSESAFARDYYDVQLSDGGLYRVFQDRRSREWFVDGSYD